MDIRLLVFIGKNRGRVFYRGLFLQHQHGVLYLLQKRQVLVDQDRKPTTTTKNILR